MNWIDVEEELPTNEQDVLVVRALEGEKHIEIGIYCRHDFLNEDRSPYTQGEIKYWLPIPEVPREEEAMRQKWVEMFESINEIISFVRDIENEDLSDLLLPVLRAHEKWVYYLLCEGKESKKPFKFNKIKIEDD